MGVSTLSKNSLRKECEKKRWRHCLDVDAGGNSICQTGHNRLEQLLRSFKYEPYLQQSRYVNCMEGSKISKILLEGAQDTHHILNQGYEVYDVCKRSRVSVRNDLLCLLNRCWTVLHVGDKCRIAVPGKTGNPVGGGMVWINPKFYPMREAAGRRGSSVWASRTH